MIDRLWHLKFYSQFPVPGNQVSVYFDDEKAARGIMDRHAIDLGAKAGEACETMIFEDLMGRHCFRPDFFPYAVLYEIGPAEQSWKEIEDKIKASQRAADTNKEMGFKPVGPENEKD